MKRQHQPARAESMEKLQQHHRQHRPGLRQIDRRMPQLAAAADEFASQPDLAGQIVRAFERQAVEAEG